MLEGPAKVEKDSATLVFRSLYRAFTYSWGGAFTLSDTKTDTHTDKLTQNPTGMVSVQYEHVNTILFDPFFVNVCIDLGVGQREHTINATVSHQYIH